MTKDEYIEFLEQKIKRLEKKISDYSWRINPDRSGGQFSDWEKNRRGHEFS